MMRNYIRILLISAALLVFAPSFAQSGSTQQAEGFEVEGVVLDANSGEPLGAAQIGSTEIKRSVVTGADGKFTLIALSETAVLNVTKDGYYVKRVDLYGRKNLVIRIQRVDKTMATDYYLTPVGEVLFDDKIGTAEAVDVSLLNKASASLSDALSGHITGLQVRNKSGMLGEGSYYNLRGNRTIYGQNNPLVVIDGVPIMIDPEVSAVVNGYCPDVLEVANINNIEKIAFLKGADALQYGSLGSNGVLMIETQRGKVSRTSVEFQSVEGVGMVTSRIPMMNAAEYQRYIGDITSSYAKTLKAINTAFPYLGDEMTPQEVTKFSYDTNWQDTIYQPALYTDNMLKVRGGDAIVQYLATAGYQVQRGVIGGTDRSKFYTGGNTNINFSDKLRALASVAFDFVDMNLAEQGMSYETNPLLAAYTNSPMLGAYAVDEAGGVTKEWNPYDPTVNASNPAAVVNDITASNKVYDFLVNVGMDYQMTKNLKADIKFGIFYKYVKDDLFIAGKDTQAIVPLQDGYAENTVRSGASESKDYFGKAGLSYDLAKKGHEISANLGWQIVASTRTQSLGSGINTSTDFYHNLNNTSSVGRNTGGYADALNWMNGYAKLDYNYRHQFYLGLAGTADYSSSYGLCSDRLYFHPAAKVGWKISNCGNMKNSDFISNMMLRAEYSQNPNSRYNNTYSSYYYKLNLIKDVSGIVRAGLPNEKLGPEVVNNYNIGFDTSIFGDRFTFSGELYREQVNNMIVASSVSPVYGFDSVYSNSGKMRTNGIDFKVSFAVIDKAFQWRVGGSISFFDSKIQSLGGRDEQQVITLSDGAQLVNKVGYAPYSFYGWRTEGIYSSSREASKAGLKTYSGVSFSGGDVKYSDVNRDGVISDKDRMILGSQEPNAFGSIYSNMTWKGFTLFANFGFTSGNMLYNATRRFNEDTSNFMNKSKSVNRRWVAEGQVTDVAKAVYGDPAGNNRFSQRWIEDGSYLKLKELTFSWQTKDRIFLFYGMKVYVTAENLFCLTNYTGSDPEFAYSYDKSTIGVDWAKVPLPKFLKFGLVLNL